MSNLLISMTGAVGGWLGSAGYPRRTHEQRTSQGAKLSARDVGYPTRHLCEAIK